MTETVAPAASARLSPSARGGVAPVAVNAPATVTVPSSAVPAAAVTFVKAHASEKFTLPAWTCSASPVAARTVSRPAPTFSTATRAVHFAFSVPSTSSAPSTSVPVAVACVFVTTPRRHASAPVLVTPFTYWRVPQRSRQQ